MMIITCENCSKTFNIQEKLIPTEGRLLQCGVCNYKWFFKTSISEDENKKNYKRKRKPKIIKNFIVFIISIIAIIIFLDTFKYQLNNYIPGINSVLNNLYETLKDLSLFFKDLVN